MLSRKFVAQDIKLDTWDKIKPYCDDLVARPLTTIADLQRWCEDRSELESILEEEQAWRYIRMTCDTADTERSQAYEYFISEVIPQIAPYSDILNKKLVEDINLDLLTEGGFDIYIRSVKNDIELFREINIPLHTQADQESQKYGAINGAMMVTLDGVELTLQQASDKLYDSDRALRELVWYTIQNRRRQDKDVLNELYSKLIQIRHQIALNAGFDNYRDYMFRALGRFDYTAEDCFRFHEAIEVEVVPLLNGLAAERKAAMQLEVLRPWDASINYHGTEPLRPFDGGEDLLAKTISCFSKIDPYLGSCLTTMKTMGHLDLSSRKGKAPGGYNYPLDETGIPFIFMNASSALRDVVTLIHEGGHALHSFHAQDLSLGFFKHPPSEVAELASMSMELISMEHWGEYFADQKDLIRAKREHLEGIIQTLPWVATIDCFQHWIYTHPSHTVAEREAQWLLILARFSNDVTDWTGLEEYKKVAWQKQLHLYEVPFYYIEYGMAQLGAVAVWKNCTENKATGYAQYNEALKLGYSKSINDIYATAGISFDFSTENIKALMAFVKKELDDLEK